MLTYHKQVLIDWGRGSKWIGRTHQPILVSALLKGWMEDGGDTVTTTVLLLLGTKIGLGYLPMPALASRSRS